MPFIADAYHLNRFEALIKAWKRKLILAHKVCLLQDGPILHLTVVEYAFVNYQSNPLRSLKDFLTSDDEEIEDEELRKKIFNNLCQVTNQIHELGVPHLSINPEKVWIKNNSKVYLLPFDVHYEENTDTYAMWYSAPEYLFNSPEYYFNYECDVWSLGCIFYDLFINSPPLFASVDPHAKLIRLFELLGFPDLEHVPYMNADTHEHLHQNVFLKEWKIRNMPQIFDLIQNLHPPIATAFLNMLHFNPHDRPTINFKSLFNGKV